VTRLTAEPFAARFAFGAKVARRERSSMSKDVDDSRRGEMHSFALRPSAATNR
jgi:hypothetical protein